MHNEMNICVNKRIIVFLMLISMGVLALFGYLAIRANYGNCKIGRSVDLLIKCLPKPTPTPIKPTMVYLKAPKNSSEIIWENYNFTNPDKKIAFSFQHPDIGDFCNGCFDAAGRATNYFGVWITGGYYKVTTAGTWSLMVNVYLPHAKKTAEGFFDEKIGGEIAKLKAVKIGDQFQEKDSGGLVSTTTRMNDVLVTGGKYARHFKTIGQGTRIAEMTIIELPNYTIVATYSYVPPVYGVFEKIISSFSQELYTTPTYGETLEHYNKRSNGDPPWR
jgi:hypothetical protein